VNADPRPQLLTLPTLRGHAFELHPVHRAPGAGDPRPAREAAFDPATGQLTVPARTAVVFVVN
jgi:pullulanase